MSNCVDGVPPCIMPSSSIARSDSAEEATKSNIPPKGKGQSHQLLIARIVLQQGVVVASVVATNHGCGAIASHFLLVEARMGGSTTSTK